MKTRPQYVRFQYIAAGVIIAAILGGVIYQSMESTVFFYTPGEILAEPAEFRGREIRIGALVVPDSTQWDPNRVLLRFKVTEDDADAIQVIFPGVKPDMFREGQGVVVEGRMDAAGVFQANTVLVKHSEDYTIDKDKQLEKEKKYRSLMR